MEKQENNNSDLFSKMLNIVTKLQVDFGFDDIYQSTYCDIEIKGNDLNTIWLAKVNEWYYKIEQPESS